MEMQPLPAYFMVKVNKQDQHERRQKDGNWFNHPDHVFMQYEQQWGEVVSVGELAAKEFPEAVIGSTLIFHHFVTGKGEMEDDGDNIFFIGEEEGFRYYVVPATYIYSTGDKNLVYGAWNGSEIIPHKDYIFLQPEPELSNTVSVSENGLLTLNNWRESREESGDKMASMKRQVAEMTKTSTVTNELTEGIQKKEAEMNAISKRINQKEYCTYDIANINPGLKSKFPKPFTKAGMLNMACHLKLSFRERIYVVAPASYLAFVK